MDRQKVAIIFRSLWYRKEALIWIAALAFLALSDPFTHHYSLCPLSNMGISWCPGCGLGHSVSLLFRFDFYGSFMAHPLGIPAIGLIVYRIIKVFRNQNHFKISTI
ncbi:MAG TPA: DUF2752 domain-containing protein [Bacteroidales bacterium]|nr:DUF2752 domain-containing protein [Bacteroidales bacterium]HOX78538.1 DUF2752 domain-containing protein [Bacteroidales bacterium]HPI86842.1 DUF2752 domain-containing protein [Bacteroidales bacterium]